MNRRAGFLAVLLLASAAPAAADPQSEALLRRFVDSVDALPEWAAAVTTIRSDGDNTIAEGLTMSRAEPRVELQADMLRVLDLVGRDGGGFVAAEVELTNGSLRSAAVDYSIPSALASIIAMPGFEGVVFDSAHMMTAIAQACSAASAGELGELAIPEMTAVQRQAGTADSPPRETQITYRDVVTSGLRAGTLRSQSFGPISMAGTDENGKPVEIGIEAVAAENLDLDAIGHIFDPAAYRDRRGDGIWRPLISRLVASGLSASGPDGASFRLDSYAVENIDARQPRRPMTAMWDRMLDPAVPREMKNDLALEALQTMLEAWRLGTFRLHGITIEAPSENNRFALETLTISGLSEVGIDSVLLKALSGESANGFLSLAAFELAGFAFPDFNVLMKFAALEPDTGPAEHAETVRSSFAALPRVSHVGLNGLKAGLNAAEAVTVDALSIDISDWNAVFAEASDLRLEGVTVPRTLVKLDPETQRLVDTLAPDPMVFGVSISNRWSPEAGTDTGVWSFSMKDAAEVEFSYTLTGLTLDWVTDAIAAAGQGEDSEAAIIAMYNTLALKGSSLKVADRSLLDRAFAVAAQKQNLTVDGAAYRAQMRGALPFLLSAAVPAELSKLLSAPLQAFLEGGQTLVAEISPPQPIPLPELVAAGSRDPMALPGFLGLTLRSEASP